MGLLPHRWLRRLEYMMVAAGEPIDLGLFVLLWILVIVVGGVAGMYVGPWGWIPIGAGLGAYLPFFWLRNRMEGRQRAIRRALPDAIDLLVTCVEAGLGLDASMIRVGGATKGPLGDEIARTLREISVGRPRQDALLELGTRSGVPELDGVMRPIVQAERSGVSIATALRVQAEALRVRRRQKAEEAAHKIPVKMTLVMAAVFIPCVMLIAVAPAVFRLYDFFTKEWL
jgi:tight adherence protein C